MRIGVWHIFIAIVWLNGALLAALETSHAKEAAKNGIEVRAAKTDATEQYERDVDEVALSAQDKAIAKLQTLLKKYSGTRQEPVLLAKLADFQQQSASILFRIAHGNANRAKGAPQALDLTRYNRIMTQAIQSYSRLIERYPGYEEIPHAYYSRGKAYEDLEKKTNATNDYLFLVRQFPSADEAASAYMALAEFAIQDNDHPKAISYLREVEKRPESPHYPFALYKLAWSHYNLKEIPVALSYAERQIKYYSVANDAAEKANDENAAANGFSVGSDAALRENTLLDVTVFYFEGYEGKLAQYGLDNALPYFLKLAKADAGSMKAFGKMLVRFAKLLRSHGHEADLISWKNEILARESDKPESLDVVLVTYEYQLNKRRYKQLVETAQDMIKLYQKGKGYESFPAAQKLLLDTADGLQALVIKNKAADEVGAYSAILASVYDAFTKIVEESDPRIPRVHYNLAETLFAIKEYGGATDHYRWIVEHGEWKKSKKDEPGAIADASLKAIASRYEVLRRNKLIPTELRPVAVQKNSPSKLDPALAQWVEWVDTHEKHRPEKADNFLFESYRAQYAQGHVVDVLAKLAALIFRNPKSPYAIPAASLMLDTHVASEDWEKTHQLANDFMKLPEWKTADFSKRLFAIASDAAYKKIEVLYKTKDYATALKGVDDFLERYDGSVRVADALTLAGSAAIAQNDKKLANSYYSRLIQAASAQGKPIDAGNLKVALLARAHLAEDEYRFANAARDYMAYLRVAPNAAKGASPEPNSPDKDSPDKDSKEKNPLRIKALALIWLANDMTGLRAALAKDSTGLCTEDIASDCEKYRALLALSSSDPAASPDSARNGEVGDLTAKAFEAAHKGSENSTKEIRTIWAAVALNGALNGAKSLAFRDRNHMIKAVAAGWGDLDPLVRFSILPHLIRSIPKAFETNRLAMKDVAPLRADERYITHRVDMIREMENAATKALKLPWARIRSEVSNQIAGLYIDLARGLGSLNPPKNLSADELAAYQETIRKLVMPFEEKGQDLRGKAFEIASRFAIEDDSFVKVSEPFFAENPSQAKKLRSLASVSEPSPLGLEFLAGLDPAGRWLSKKPESSSVKDGPDNRPDIGALWANAIRNKQWQQVAFFMQQSQEKAAYRKAILAVIKAVSLSSVGARAEALTEIDEAREELAPKEWLLATTTLAQYYSKSMAHEKLEALNKEIEKAQERSQEKVQAETEKTRTLASDKH